MKTPSLLLKLTVAITLLSSVVHAVNEQPNILFLFSDDQRPDTIHAFGNDHIRTPNIDKLVHSGTSFTNNYCMGSNSPAVCLPSRAMINSGRTLFRVEHDLSDAPTMGETLRKSGYHTFGTGKWHNSAEAYLRSFESGKNAMIGGMSNHLKVPVCDIVGGALSKVKFGEGYSTNLFADAAIDFLKTYKDEKPFFCYLAFTTPHDPRMPIDSYRKAYDGSKLPLPINYLPYHPFETGGLQIRDEELLGFPRDPDLLKEQLAEYYAMITHMDERIGDVIQALKDSGEFDNTIIVYTSDHGLSMGSHGLLGKQNLYEGSMDCPLIFSGPGIPKDKKIDAFSYLLDIFPTLCEVASIEVPEKVEGQSLMPLWNGTKQSLRDSVITIYEDSVGGGCVQRAVRNDKWKLIVYPQINKVQLFDLELDPYEMNDISSLPRFEGNVAEMTALLKDWQKEIGDTQALTTDNPRSSQVDVRKLHRGGLDYHRTAQPKWLMEKYFQDAIELEKKGEYTGESLFQK